MNAKGVGNISRDFFCDQTKCPALNGQRLPRSAMKRLFAVLLAATSLSGCVLAPVDPGPYPMPDGRYPNSYPAPYPAPYPTPYPGYGYPGSGTVIIQRGYTPPPVIIQRSPPPGDHSASSTAAPRFRTRPRAVARTPARAPAGAGLRAWAVLRPGAGQWPAGGAGRCAAAAHPGSAGAGGRDAPEPWPGGPSRQSWSGAGAGPGAPAGPGQVAWFWHQPQPVGRNAVVSALRRRQSRDKTRWTG